MLADKNPTTQVIILGKFYSKLYSLPRLRQAWRVVQQNGLASKSPQTRQEIEEFSANIDRHLQRIIRQLKASKFVFPPSLGVAAQKKGKSSKRPIVISPVKNRIVQRAILDVIQEIPEIKAIQDSRFNYGGVLKLGVPEAINAAYDASIDHGYFIRTDIKSFFINIPRDRALRIISKHVDDLEFNDLLEQATITELINIAALGRDSELFPLENIGVAQGSCLSPLLCNLLLHDFDKKMNGRGIKCIRYIDDFILFAKNKEYAIKALHDAIRILDKMKLEIYIPSNDSDKAEQGLTKDGFDFLGCNIKRNRVRPTNKATKNLIDKIKSIAELSLKAISQPESAIKNKNTYKDALVDISNTIRGWGNTYFFCTDDQLMSNLDQHIAQLIGKFDTSYQSRIKKLTQTDLMRIRGIYLLQDCKKQKETDDESLRNKVAKYKNLNT